MADIKNAPPSKNPANDDSMTGMFRQILDKFLQNTDDMLPARVVAFDRASNRAQVQPLIMVVDTNNNRFPRAQIASVPVLQMGGGGFMMNYNLNPGDFGWIKANDRDISLFTQAYSENAPNTRRKHSFEDAVFIPDVMTGFEINPEDATNVVWQTLDGSQRIAIWADRIKITSTNKIILDAPLIEITGELDSGTDSGGLAHFSGSVQVDGNIHSNGDATAGSISLEHHIHSASGGTGNGGPPVP